MQEKNNNIFKLDYRSFARNYLQRPVLSPYFPWMITAIGLIIRLRQFVTNRSLWLDEASLALNIVNRSFAGLLEPLDYGQSAPPFFLLSVEFLTQLFGESNEYILRLLPFLAGSFALILFCWLTYKTLSPLARVIAVTLFAFSEHAIYYSSEFKQYSVELLVTVILLIFALYVYRSGFQNTKCLLFGLVGALLVWFSYSSVFLLAGIGLAYLMVLYIEGNEHKILPIIVMGSLWITSFTLEYYFIIKLVDKTHFMEFWDSALLHFPPTTLNELKWYPATVLKVLRNPLGFRFFLGVAIVAIIVGGITFFNKNKNMLLYTILFSLITILIVSMLGYYPIHGRLVLFTLPLFCLLIGQGASSAFHAISEQSLLIAVLFLSILIVYPVGSGLMDMVSPTLKEETRPLVNYYVNHRKKGDKIYVYYGALKAFKYYKRNRDIQYISGEKISGGSHRGQPSQYLAELQQLKGAKRAWLLISHDIKNEEKLFKSYLNYVGERQRTIHKKGASLYLYDFSNWSHSDN